MIDELIELATDPAHGTTRVLLLSALERSRDPRARGVLDQLASDPAVSQEVAAIRARARKRKR